MLALRRAVGAFAARGSFEVFASRSSGRFFHTRESEFSLTTLNLHCPLYKRLPAGDREADHQEVYLPRTERILDLLLRTASSIFCLQEFWADNERIVEEYQNRLGAAGYTLYITPRTGGRGDGLCTAVDQGRFEIIDRYNIPFRDIGDRVAHLLHLKAVDSQHLEDEVLVINVHLMFPHDVNCTVVRLRQCGKMLSKLKAYLEEKGLCEVPIVIAGDWNGTSRGNLAEFMRSQGFISVYDELNPDGRWVSHLNHNQQAVAVDCVWLLNPSAQAGGLTANWRRTACANVAARLVHQGVRTHSDALAYFDRSATGIVTVEDFVDGVRRLGMTGAQSIGLLPQEIQELVEYCDADGDGRLMSLELQRAVDVEQAALVLDAVDGQMSKYLMYHAALSCPVKVRCNPRDLEIRQATLPETFNRGIWPPGFRDEISDHAPLTATLAFPMGHP